MENKVPNNTITRDIKDLAAPTGAEKKELNKRLEEFRNERDTMEETFENKEQIEISKYFERQPKPGLVAISEFEDGELSFRFAKSDAKAE